MGIQGAALDAANTGTPPSVLPGDLDVKTNLEYVTFLVQHGIFKESDLSIFCVPGKHIAALRDLREENILFRFARVSKNDPSDTIFFATKTNVEPPQPRSLWERLFHHKKEIPRIVFRIGGDADRYNQLPNDPSQMGKLPPREPAFLAP